MRLDSQQRGTVEDDAAGIGLKPADKAVQQCRFSGPVRPDNRVHGSLFDGQVYIVQCTQAPEVFIEVFNFENAHLISKSEMMTNSHHRHSAKKR